MKLKAFVSQLLLSTLLIQSAHAGHTNRQIVGQEIVLGQIATPSNPPSGKNKLYTKSDNKVYYLDSSGNEKAVGSGSGGGDLNFISLDSSYQPTSQTNSDLETSVGGWTAYADAAGTAPVDMTGGSPTVTCDRSISSPLNGAASLLMTIGSGVSHQGEGCSLLVNVPPGYRTGRDLALTFPYSISGTLVQDDLKIYVYAVDGASAGLITPTTYSDILGSSGTAYVSFPPFSDTTQYRIGIHVARTSTGALTAKTDDFELQPKTPAMGLAGSGWTAYTPTFSSSLGTISGVEFYYRKVGDSVEINGRFTQGGTLTSSEAQVGLPTGLTSDSTLITTIRQCGHYSLSVASARDGTVLCEGGKTYVSLGVQSTSSAGLTKVGGNTGDVGATFSLNNVVVPISGWNANTSIGTSSTFRMASIIANGTRVTSTPTKLGEYRTRYRASATSSSLTDVAPTTAPTAADGMKIYGDVPWASAGTSGQISVWDIFVGKRKNVRVDFWSGSGRTGLIDTHFFLPSSSTIVGAFTAYDETTGILTIDAAFLWSGSETSRYLGMTPSSGGNGAGPAIGSGYFDIVVSENFNFANVESPRSSVECYGGNGYGSSSTKVRRLSVCTTTGSAVVYSDDAATGGLFTVKEDGVYSMRACDTRAAADMSIGISMNTTGPTTAIDSLGISERIAYARTAGANDVNCVDRVKFLPNGTAIRDHNDGSSTDVTAKVTFEIVKISN